MHVGGWGVAFCLSSGGYCLIWPTPTTFKWLTAARAPHQRPMRNCSKSWVESSRVVDGRVEQAKTRTRSIRIAAAAAFKEGRVFASSPFDRIKEEPLRPYTAQRNLLLVHPRGRKMHWLSSEQEEISINRLSNAAASSSSSYSIPP